MGAPGASGTFPHGAAFHEAVAEGEAIVAHSQAASIRLGRAARLCPVAFETISADPFMWNHGVALCVPDADLLAAPADTIRDMALDAGAIRPGDRSARCFDLGIGSQQARVLIRSADFNVTDLMGRFVGETFSGLPKAALDVLAASRLDWVVETPIGRLEMRQQADVPSGVEPYPPFIDIRLLKSGLTYARSTCPPGLVPCGYIFPSHPARQAPGVAKDFDRLEHARFQATLDRFGVPALVRLKREVEAALDGGAHPPSGVKTRHEIDVVRVALRQRLVIGSQIDLAPWLSVFDKPLLAAISARGGTRQSS